MKTRAMLAIAVTLSLLASVVAAAPWDRADSKILGSDYANQSTTNQSSQVRRSTRAYSYSPPVAAPIAPVRAQANPQPTPAPQARVMQTAPRAAAQPMQNYVQPQARSYRSYSYQPTVNGRSRSSSRAVPFYLRADSKLQGREGKY